MALLAIFFEPVGGQPSLRAGSVLVNADGAAHTVRHHLHFESWRDADLSIRIDYLACPRNSSWLPTTGTGCPGIGLTARCIEHTLANKRDFRFPPRV
jgi:hypothetical protein